MEAADALTPFDSSSIPASYFSLGSPTLVLEKTTEPDEPHTMSVIQVDSDYTYWCWYGMEAYPGGGPVYLAKSNDLLTWTKAGSVISGNNRWPCVVKVGSTFYMAVTAYGEVSHLQSTVLKSSSDGLTWSNVGTLVAEATGYHNDNSQLYLDPVSNEYYYFHTNIRDSDSFHTIYARHAAVITDLIGATDAAVLTSNSIQPSTKGSTIASPSVIYVNGIYYLTVEISIGGTWKVLAFWSRNIISGYAELKDNNPILTNDDACLFHHRFGNTLHVYYSERVGGTTWNMQHRSASL